MRGLTETEVKVLNNVTREIDPSIFFGNFLQYTIGELNKAFGVAGTPVNAAAAKATLTIDGVVKDWETVTIGEYMYIFSANEHSDPAISRYVYAEILDKTTQASANLTLAVQPTSGDTFTIGTKTYIFVPVGTDTADGEISIGADLAGAKANFVAAINGTDNINDKNILVKASEFVGNVCTLTALIGGTLGDGIELEETFTDPTNILSAAVLSGGVDCSAENAIAALVTAVNGNTNSPVVATAGANGTIVLTASIGETGNDISVTANMTNGSFGDGVDALTGGRDTTPSNNVRFMVDDTNLYIFVGDSWYKIQLAQL